MKNNNPGSIPDPKMLSNYENKQQTIHLKRIKFALSKKQREDILNVSKNNNYLHYLIILTQIKTGMRISEVVNLIISQINFEENYIHLESYQANRHHSSWKPKTESGNRVIPIDQDLSDELRLFIKKRRNGYVFISPQKKRPRFNPKSLINMINSYAYQCSSISRAIGSHSLRRTYASYLISKNIPIGTISKILGHKSIKITLNYLFEITNLSDFKDVRKIIAEI